MSRKFIPADEAIDRRLRDPEFVAEYQAQDEEFSLAASLIKACEDMTQEELAAAARVTIFGYGKRPKKPQQT